MILIEKNDSIFELPYKLMDIDMVDEHFSLAFIKFDEGQSEYSINHSGITGDFEIAYKCSGIESKFECDMTIGNLYYFFVALDNAYDIENCKNNIVTLENYGSSKRSVLKLKFDNGRYFVNGYFKNKNNKYNSSIGFNFEIFLTDIVEILISLDNFFSEIRRIQGNNNFY